MTTAAASPAALFDALVAVHERKGKSHMIYKQEGELHIFHYGGVVQNAGHWDADVLLARGLIFKRNEETGETSLVATPWPKFFNLGEDGLELSEMAAAVEGGGWVEVTSKMDGSLGLLFHHEGRWRCTTKGDFLSLSLSLSPSLSLPLSPSLSLSLSPSLSPSLSLPLCLSFCPQLTLTTFTTKLLFTAKTIQRFI